MRNKFHGYYTPSIEEFDALWDKSLIVVDASVLLNLYAYSTDTWEEVLRLLEELSERIWLPYQAAGEYHRNRCGAIVKEARPYGKISGDLRSLRDALGARKQHPFIDAEKLEQFKQLVEQIEHELETRGAAHKRLILEDPICERITRLFEGRVGDPLAADELEKIYAEGAERYAKRNPPGYKDEEKPEPDRYGDLVVWKELIQHATQTERGVIFVTDDAKEDWWLTSGNTKIGPRPELLHEFREKTGQGLYIYGTDKFVEIARERGKVIAEKAVKELEAAAKQRQLEKDAQLAALRALREATMNSLAEYKAMQQAVREATMSPLAEYKAMQHAVREATMSPLAEYKAMQQALREATMSPLAEHKAMQRALREAAEGIRGDMAEQDDEPAPDNPDDDDSLESTD